MCFKRNPHIFIRFFKLFLHLQNTWQTLIYDRKFSFWFVKILPQKHCCEASTNCVTCLSFTKSSFSPIKGLRKTAFRKNFSPILLSLPFLSHESPPLYDLNRNCHFTGFLVLKLWFVDAPSVCDDSQLEANIIVLLAASPFFRATLSRSF